MTTTHTHEHSGPWTAEKVVTLAVLFAYKLGRDGEYHLTHRVGASTTAEFEDPYELELGPAWLLHRAWCAGTQDPGRFSQPAPINFSAPPPPR